MYKPAFKIFAAIWAALCVVIAVSGFALVGRPHPDVPIIQWNMDFGTVVSIGIGFLVAVAGIILSAKSAYGLPVRLALLIVYVVGGAGVALLSEFANLNLC